MNKVVRNSRSLRGNKDTERERESEREKRRRRRNGKSKGYPLCARVFISKPRVGLVFETSSLLSFFTMVVFPALSKPLRFQGKEKKNFEKSEGGSVSYSVVLTA